MKDFRREFYRAWRGIWSNKELRSLILLGFVVYGILMPAIYIERRLRDVPVGLVDLDHSRLSRTLSRMLDATEGAELSATYIDQQQGMTGLAEHEVNGLLIIPKHFEQKWKKRQASSAALGIASSNLITGGPLVQAGSGVAGTLSAATLVAQARAKGMARDRALFLAQPLRLDVRPIYNPALNYADSTVPGLMFIILQQLIIVGLCFGVAEAKELKNFRHRFDGVVPTLSNSLAQILPFVLVNFVLSLIYLLVLRPVFQLPLLWEHLPAAALLCLVFGCATSAMALLLSHAFHDRITVLVCMTFYSMPGYLSSGYSWPSEMLPLDVRIFGFLFPITYFADEIRRVCLGPIHLAQYVSTIASLGLYALVCLILNLLVIWRQTAARGEVLAKAATESQD